MALQIIETRPAPVVATSWRNISDIFTPAEAKRMLADIDRGRLQGALVVAPYMPGFVFVEGHIAPRA